MIVVLADYYHPSTKAGGPLKSVRALVRSINKPVIVITRNIDIDGTKLKLASRVRRVDGVPVIYLDRIRVINLFIILTRLNPQLVVCNSFHSPLSLVSGIYSKMFGISFVLFPRGELSQSALKHKRIIKNLTRNIYFFVYNRSSFFVSGAISTGIERLCKLYWVNLREITPVVDKPVLRMNQSEGFRIVFISRVVPIKNLDFFLDIYREESWHYTLDIYGPFESMAYQNEIFEKIKVINSSGGSVRYSGVLDPRHVAQVLSTYSDLILPSLSENFGHVIYEALSCNVYTHVSDRTYWTQERLGVQGKILPLDKDIWKQSVQNRYADIKNVFPNNMAEKYYEESQERINSIIDGL